VAAQDQAHADAFFAEFKRNDSTYAMEYLFDEVLNHAPAPLQTFLIKTALLARFDAELAAFVTQTDVVTARQMIEELRRQNLFVVTLDAEYTWVRYHHQFKAMLINRARLTLHSNTVRSLRNDAAAWLASHGWNDEALTEYFADQAWEKAADLIAADAHRLQNREEWYVLWRRLAQLPDTILTRRPALLLAQAWILQIQNRNGAIPALVEQAAAFNHDGSQVVTASIHGTTNEQPFARLPDEQLTAIHDKPDYDTAEITHRSSSRDCLISYRGNFYSVPAACAGQHLQIRVTELDELTVLNADGWEIARHRLVHGNGERCVVTSHYAALLPPSSRSAPTSQATQTEAPQIQPVFPGDIPHVVSRPLSEYQALLEVPA
jgi:hypothetical protein